ncbi:hypothetical protein M0813_13432 [Anaeramoeba flamelloides]|uniref:Uncharacterized protein n=1 Tax=Anaeramoeba flamelloides TaxID=1746091 RepID=A0ABQ8Z952_9EUKA|nr:hypothetical protein M0813_13432 [Anaeramoeba flamelloides]
MKFRINKQQQIKLISVICILVSFGLFFLIRRSLFPNINETELEDDLSGPFNELTKTQKIKVCFKQLPKYKKWFEPEKGMCKIQPSDYLLESKEDILLSILISNQTKCLNENCTDFVYTLKNKLIQTWEKQNTVSREAMKSIKIEDSKILKINTTNKIFQKFLEIPVLVQNSVGGKWETQELELNGTLELPLGTTQITLVFTDPDDTSFKTSVLYPVKLDSEQVVKERVRQRNLKNHNTVVPRTKHGKKKLNVIKVIIDSLSHPLYVQLFPILREFLNNGTQDTFETFEFLRYNIIHRTSQWNQVPSFMGMIYSNTKWKLKEGTRHHVQLCQKKNGSKPDRFVKINSSNCNRIIWNQFKDYGYLTADSSKSNFMDMCHPISSQECGKAEEWGPYVSDYHVDFTDVPEKFYRPKGYTFYKMDIYNRFHNLLVESNKKDGFPLFYSMSTLEAHANKRWKMVYCPHELLELFKKLDFENTMLIFSSDHGLHYTSHVRSEIGNTEHKYPFLSITAPKQWLDERPKIRKNLKINSNRLISQLDFYTSLYELPLLDNDPELSFSSDGIKHNTEEAYNFMTDVVPLKRKCKDPWIPTKYCGCNSKYKKITDHKQIQKFRKIIKKRINQLNHKITEPKDSICERIKLKKIDIVIGTDKKIHRASFVATLPKGKELFFRITAQDENIVRITSMNQKELDNEKWAIKHGFKGGLCFIE